VVVVAESPLLRSALSSLLSALPAVEVAAEREDLDAASLSALGGCDLLLWELPAASSRDAWRDLIAAAPCLLLLDSAGPVAELMAAGARGALWRDVDGERLVGAVQALLAGVTVLDEGMLALLFERKAAPVSGVELTPREAEVLGLMAEGLSNKLIAARLGISDHTAKFHVNAVLDKLGAETRTEAVVRAARQGLLML
jgi:DNA-binding NarL/FixJ family response regulator